jgi:hypothetical protein
MSYPKFIISYAVMDSSSGANPLGHSTILCFEQSRDDVAPKLIDAYGSYSQASSTTNLLIKSIKSLLGIKYDLQGTHSVLKKENIWTLNQGGINALHFEVTEETFSKFREDLEQQIKTQTNVIQELNRELESKGLELNGANRYKLEMKKNPHYPRLKPFHISSNFDAKDSFICKSFALELLHSHEIINDQTKQQLLGSRFASAFPINTNVKLSPVYLASTNGSCLQTVKNKNIYSYDWEQSDFRAVFPLNNELSNELSLESYGGYLIDQLNELSAIEQKLQQKIAIQQEQDLVRCREQILLVIREFTKLSISNESGSTLRNLIETLIENSQKWIDISSYSMLSEDYKNSFGTWFYNHQALDTILKSCAAVCLGLALSFGAMPISPIVGVLITFSASLVLIKKIIELKSDYEHLKHSRQLYQEEFDISRGGCDIFPILRSI